ncbi:MAG: double zinc ribbon domain-containing protein [Chloroflexota bacterium]
MARKSLGYVKTEWTCPNCSTRNPGPQKTCVNCGAPQPESVSFSLGAEPEFVKDENELKAAAAGADIHCPYCGARNPAAAQTCSQCGGDLAEGKRREAGRELKRPGGPKTVTCTNCGTDNPAAEVNCAKCGSPLPRTDAVQTPPVPAPASMAFSAPQAGAAPARPARKPNWLLLGGIAGLLLLCCIGIFTLFLAPTSSVQATVSNVAWQTSLPVQEVQAVRYTNESGSPPSDAYDVSCQTESREVCEQKTIDKGNGFAEVVEECHTESEQYCDYTVDEWKTVQTYTLEGNDFSPVYAQPDITSDQRYGKESVTYTVYFDTEKGEMTYIPGGLGEFQQFQPGSTWKLKLNALGGVVGVER